MYLFVFYCTLLYFVFVRIEFAQNANQINEIKYFEVDK